MTKQVTIWSAALGLVFAACAPAEPKTPDERIAEDEAELEDMERHGGGEGTELAADEVKKDLEEAKKEKAEQEAGEAGHDASEEAQEEPSE